MREAIKIAHEQGAAGLEMRAALSLAGLLDEQGRHAEIRAALAPTRALFRDAEGFPDLEEADRLLAKDGVADGEAVAS